MRAVALLSGAALALSTLAACGGGETPLATLPTGTEGHPWWNDTVFYEIFVRSFYDSDGDGIGDFNGIIAKLDYLNDGNPATRSDLGITGVWLMPIHPAASYHGYDVVDYFAVNPDYGTLADFTRLVEEAHRRGIRVIIDLVLNHTSVEHPWFLQAQDPASAYRDWYVWSEFDPGYRGPWGQPVWHEGESGFYFGLFWDGMPDLNYSNPEVTAQLQQVVSFWIEDVGVDGFRLDAARHLIEHGQVQQDSDATHDWYRDFRLFYKGLNPEALTVGEVWDISPIAASYALGEELDLVFDFSLAEAFIVSARVGSADAAVHVLQADTRIFRPGQFAAFLANHDQNRVASQLAGNLDKAKVAASLLLTAPGVPFIYYGEEIGMLGIKPDEDIRRPMQWSADPNAGFSSGQPWRSPDDRFASANVAQETGAPDSLLSHYRHLIQARNEHPALRVGEYSAVGSDAPSILASLRVSEAEVILVVINLGPAETTDYELAAAAGTLPPGRYEIVPLLGRGDFAELHIDSQGGFTGYRPLSPLPAYATYVLQLKPAR